MELYAGGLRWSRKLLWTMMWNEVTEFEVFCQFTGFRDMNGKEIFEGDIFSQYLNSPNSTHVVEWEEGRFMLKKYRSMPLANVVSSGEVIGNIYQNAELLK